MTNDMEMIAARLEELAATNEGRITPAMVVEDARKDDSPLHDKFNWNIEEAAMSHWLSTARAIIRSVRVIVRTSKSIVRAPFYVRDPDAARNEQGYVALTSVRGHEDQAREVLVTQFSRAAAALRRAHEVAAVLELTDEVEGLLAGIVGLQSRLQQLPPEARQ